MADRVQREEDLSSVGFACREIYPPPTTYCVRIGWRPGEKKTGGGGSGFQRRLGRGHAATIEMAMALNPPLSPYPAAANETSGRSQDR